jgi:lipopolysaccharide transport system ATP-binding protein
MSSVLVRLQGISKRYPRTGTSADRLRTLWALVSRRGGVPAYEVLQDISLEVRRGESFGIIGENGAGKSTLLKVIAGVVKPTAGRMETHGRIGALLELGAGFHPDYTGRENIRLAAALMGLSRAEIAAKIPGIVEFADVGDYIDQPIKHYSSGMVVRLGFALVTALEPDILITDEVLAVGDESFQRRCIAWMESYLGSGGTLLLCSHGMFHIQKLCKNACWIHHGRMQRYGDAFEVSQEYLAYHERKLAKGGLDESTLAVEYRICALRIEDELGRSRSMFEMGEGLRVCGQLCSPDGRPPVILIGMVRADGAPVYGVTSDTDGFVPNRLEGQRFGFSILFQNPSLLAGEYRVRAHAMDPEGLRLFDTLEEPIRILGQTRELGFCRLQHRWEPLEDQMVEPVSQAVQRGLA